MKKLVYTIAALAVAAASASCAREELAPSIQEDDIVAGNRHEMVFSTLMTKTFIEGSTPVWGSEDKVKIFWVEENEDGSFEVQNTIAPVDSVSGKIVATVGTARDYYYAVYPHWATSELTIADGQPDALTVTVRSTSGDGLWESAHYCAALTDEGSACFNFKNISNALKFTVTTPGVTEVRISTPDDSPTAAKVRFTFDGEEPSDEPVYVTPQYTSTVTIPGPGTYYAPIVYNAEWLGGFMISEWIGDELVNFAIAENPISWGRSYVWDLKTLEDHSYETSDLFFKPDGTGDKSGKDWENAADKDRLIELLSTASGFMYIQKHNLYLAEGEYDLSDNGENLENTYKFPASYGIYGSFPSTASGTDVSGSDIESHPTIFYTSSTCSNARTLFYSGQMGKVIFDGIQFGPYATTVNSRGYAMYVNANASFSADGSLTFQNCNFKGITGVAYGALDFNNGDGRFKLVNCTFDGNETTRANYGGACLYVENGLVNIEACTFKNNKLTSTGFGGAMVIAGGTVIMDQCTFTGNESGSYGGALGVGINTTGSIYAKVTNTKFESNTAQHGGAINHICGSLELDGCTISGNTCTRAAANVGGGAITTFYVKNGALPSSASTYPTKGTGATVLKNCTISGNHSYGRGGAIHHLSTGSFSIDGCTFTNNYTDTKGNGGGAIFHASSNGCCDLYVSNTVFSGNECKNSATNANGSGAAVCAKSGSNLYFSRCAFTGNVTTASGAGSVNVFDGGCTGVYMFGCSFLNNATGTSSVTTGSVPSGVFNCSFAETTQAYSGGILSNAGTKAGRCAFVNNVITGSDASALAIGGTGTVISGYNVYSAASGVTLSPLSGASDLAGKSASDVFSSMTLDGTSIPVLSALGTMLPSYADVNAMKAEIRSANEKFADWLESINAYSGFQTTWYPGACQTF